MRYVLASVLALVIVVIPVIYIVYGFWLLLKMPPGGSYEVLANMYKFKKHLLFLFQLMIIELLAGFMFFLVARQ